MDIATAFLTFIEDAELSGRASGTIQNYRDVLSWLTTNRTEINQDAFTDAIKDFHARPIQQSTMSMYCRTLKRFARFCYECGYCDEIKVPTVKEPAPPIKPLTTDQVRSILLKVRGTDFLAHRDRAIIRTLFDTGVRRSELLGMKVDDFDWKAYKVHIVGKGNRPDVVYFCSRTRQALWDYELRARDRRIGAAFWVNRSGVAMSKTALRRMCRNLGIHPHLLRHSFAVEYLKRGGDELSLKTLLRHTTLEMTARYAQLSDTDRQMLHRRHTPGQDI